MAEIEPIATGYVFALARGGNVINGTGGSTPELEFTSEGPVGDDHQMMYRPLSGHDGDYVRTSDLQKGDYVFNWRTWTGISVEETGDVQDALDRIIPVGCLRENIRFAFIPNFSKLPPTCRIVFPPHDGRQLILTVWEENSPCAGVGQRLEEHYEEPGLSTDFIRAAQGKRGVMGFVLSPGIARSGDTVKVYPPKHLR